MSIAIWSNSLSNIYLGSSAVSSVYLGSEKIRPTGYTPTNLVAYWKLNWNYNDETWNFNGSASIGGSWQSLPWSTNKYIQFSISGDNCVFTVSNNLWTRLWSTQSDMTFNWWWYFDTQPYSGSYSQYEFLYILGNGSFRVCRVWYWREWWWLYLWLGTWTGFGYAWVDYRPTTWTWHNHIYTYNKSNRQICYYVDWVLRWTATQSADYATTTTQSKCLILHNNRASNTFTWWASELIIENKVMTADEVLAYYNQTKGNYWL